MAYIYFLRPIGAAGPIKIGSTVDVKVRLSSYLTWSPIPLEIVATYFVHDGVAGKAPRPRPSIQIERGLQEKYIGYRLHHEWFRESPELLADIAAIKNGTFDPSALPKPTNATHWGGNLTPEMREARAKLRGYYNIEAEKAQAA